MQFCPMFWLLKGSKNEMSIKGPGQKKNDLQYSTHPYTSPFSKVSALKDDSWIFSSQLKGYRGQMFSGSLSNLQCAS